jgi:hypothetical protein
LQRNSTSGSFTFNRSSSIEIAGANGDNESVNSDAATDELGDGLVSGENTVDLGVGIGRISVSSAVFYELEENLIETPRTSLSHTRDFSTFNSVKSVDTANLTSSSDATSILTRENAISPIRSPPNDEFRVPLRFSRVLDRLVDLTFATNSAFDSTVTSSTFVTNKDDDDKTSRAGHVRADHNQQSNSEIFHNSLKVFKSSNNTIEPSVLLNGKKTTSSLTSAMTPRRSNQEGLYQPLNRDDGVGSGSGSDDDLLIPKGYQTSDGPVKPSTGETENSFFNCFCPCIACFL